MRRSLIVLCCAALILTGCAGGGPDPADDPKAALRSALENLGEYEGIDMTITISSDRDSLVALSEGDMSGDEADMVLMSSLNLKARATEDPADGQFEMVLDIDGDAVEMKAVDQVLYARADVRDLVERFDGNMREVDAFVEQAPPDFDFVRPAVEGEWIAMEGGDRLQEQFGAPTPGADLQENLADDLAQAIDEHSTVTSEGEDDIGHHVAAVLQVRPLFQTLTETLSQVPGANLPAGGLPDAEDVPDEEVRVDFWLADDRVERIELDVLQFGEWADEDVPEGVEQMAARIDLDEFTDEVQAPEAAARADLEQILQGFFGGFMPGGFGTDSAEGEVVQPAPGDLEELCRQLAEAPPDVQEQFAEECPNL